MCAGDNMSGESLAFYPEVIKKTFGSSQKGIRFMQLYRLKQKHNINNGEAKMEQPQEPGLVKDWMNMSTDLGRRGLELAKKFYGRLEKSGVTRNLPSSKTFSHIIFALSLSVLFGIVLNKFNSERLVERNKMWTVLYVASFGMHFGAQIWMTTVSGLVLYFSLPRHVFGNVQEHLFPAYYSFVSFVSFLMVIAYTQMQSEIVFTSKATVQIAVMSLTFMIEMFVRLYVAHTVVLLKHTKTRMEAAAGMGQEIGRHILGELENCPHYMKILRRFRRLHSYTAIGTLVTVTCSIYHINYLADKICM